MIGVSISSLVTAVQSSTVTSFVVPMPPGAVPGDLVMVCASKNQTTGFSWPSGWTLPGAPTGASGGTRSEARYRVLQPGDPFAITITSAGAGRWSGVSFRITRHLGTPGGLADGSPSASAPNPPALTGPYSLWIAYGGTLNQTSPSAPPAGYQALGTVSAALGPTAMWASRQTLLGSDDPGPFSGVSDPWRAITIGIGDLGPAVPGSTQAQVGTDGSAAGGVADTTKVVIAGDDDVIVKVG